LQSLRAPLKPTRVERSETSPFSFPEYGDFSLVPRIEMNILFKFLEVSLTKNLLFIKKIHIKPPKS